MLYSSKLYLDKEFHVQMLLHDFHEIKIKRAERGDR